MRKLAWITVLAVASLGATGCDDDDDSGAGGTTPDSGASLDGGMQGADLGAGGTDAGPSPDAGPPADPLYAVGGYFIDADGNWIGYLTLVDDITASGTVDPASAVEFPDDYYYDSPGDGRIYVGNGGKPVIERWVLDADERLVKDAEMGLGQYGIESGLGNLESMHFVSAEKAYFFDPGTLQFVVWNPRTMETVKAVSLESLFEEGHTLALNFLDRHGDDLLLSVRYWVNDEYAAKLTRVAIIDTTTDEVSIIEDTRCGNVAFHATDSQNNLYLASHAFQAAALAVGAAGDPAAPACILRIRNGAKAFDPDYFVDMTELAGGPAAVLMQGPGDTAYILVYAGDPLTEENYFRAHRSDVWELHAITLGDAAPQGTTKVEGLPLQSGYGSAFLADIGGEQVPYVISVDGAFEDGAYFDASNPSSFTRALDVPGFPGRAIRLR